MAIIVLEQIQKDIENLPEDAQYLLIDFLEILKKRYSKTAPNPLTVEEDWSDFIGCLEGGPGDLATNKQYMEGFGE